MSSTSQYRSLALPKLLVIMKTNVSTLVEGCETYLFVFLTIRLLLRTGRIGSRRQLAENAWLVSLGCSGGAQRSCRVHLHIIQRSFYGNPILRKIGQFSLYACGNGLNLPHVAKRAFGGQIGPNVQKAMPFGSPPYHGLKNCELSQFFFHFSTLFWVHRVLFAVFALLAILCGWHTF